VGNRIGGFDSRRPGCYLVKEKKPDLAYQLLKQLLGEGLHGMVITRQYPDRVRGDHGLAPEVKVLWLSHTPGEDYHNPTAIGMLAKTISRFIEDEKGEAVVLLNGLEYLVVNNGFLRTLMFVEHVNEFVMQRKAVVIISMNPEAIQEKELAMLERNLTTLDCGGRDPVDSQPPVVRLLPKTEAARETCTRLRDRLIAWATADIDDSVEPLDFKIRMAQRNRIPFVVIVSGGENPPEVVDVILWTGEERVMSLNTLFDEATRWRKRAGLT